MKKVQSSYDVGYGKPPAQHRFKKGQSGYPRGRRKGSANLMTLVNNELDTLVTIEVGSRRRRVTKRQAAAMRLANMFTMGDPKLAGQATYDTAMFHAFQWRNIATNRGGRVTTAVGVDAAFTTLTRVREPTRPVPPDREAARVSSSPRAA